MNFLYRCAKLAWTGIRWICALPFFMIWGIFTPVAEGSRRLWRNTSGIKDETMMPPSNYVYSYKVASIAALVKLCELADPLLARALEQLDGEVTNVEYNFLQVLLERRGDLRQRQIEKKHKGELRGKR